MKARRRYGIYIHVPFCSSICSYCHFARTDRHDPALRRRYAAALLREWELRRAACGSLRSARRELATLYLGGGTPSLLEAELTAGILARILGEAGPADDCEVTAEANPESLTAGLARSWRDAGVGRVSLGVQSLDDRVLALLGRRCDGATARRGLRTACAEFPRVSADWILGPGVRAAALLAELDEAADLGVEHFSLYLLEAHAGTALQRDLEAGRLAMPPDAELEALYLAARDHLEGLGFRQYEVANFARPGAESRHNRAYWRGRPYLGLGPGAHGYYGRLRYANPRLDNWLQDLEGGGLPRVRLDRLDRDARRLERLVLGLRTAAGIATADLPERFAVEPGIEEGLWELRGPQLVLTGRGILRIDTIEAYLARCLD